MENITSFSMEQMYWLTKIGTALTIFSASLLVLSVAIIIGFTVGYFAKDEGKRPSLKFLIFPFSLFFISLMGVTVAVVFPSEKDFRTFCSLKLQTSKKQ